MPGKTGPGACRAAGLFFRVRTGRAAAMNRDIVALGAEALGQGHGGLGRQADIEDTLATVAIKMAMLLHVGAITSSGPL